MIDRPNVGEYFISNCDSFCQMIEVDMYRDFSLYGRTAALHYIAGTAFSKKRDATEEEIKLKRVLNTINLEEIDMSTEFTITLEDGHDTTTGLDKLEASYIEYVYALSKYNQSLAAKNLGLSRGCFRMKLAQYFGDKYL